MVKKAPPSPLPQPPTNSTQNLAATQPPMYTPDLQDLQAETTMILQQFGGKSQKLKASGKMQAERSSRRQARRGKKKKGKKIKVKANYENKAIDPAVAMAETVVDQKPAAMMTNFRSTVEVMDDYDTNLKMYDSDDDYPTNHEETLNQREKAKALQEKEKERKDLTFKGEESRVRLSVDAFKTGEDVTLEQLYAERDRLNRIQNIDNYEVAKRREAEAEKEKRINWLREDTTANEFQRLFRGYLGRRRAKILREINRQGSLVETAWVEVRDQERGEVWFYNSISGESVWERPAEMGGMTEPEKVNTLPPVGDIEKVPIGDVVKGWTDEEKKDGDSVLPDLIKTLGVTAGEPTSPTTHSPTSDEKLPPIKKASDDEDEDDEVLSIDLEDVDQEEDDYELSDMEEEANRMFLADGSVNVRLRDTIAQSLRVSRFDSVSTLLASGGPELSLDEKKRKAAAQRKKKKKKKTTKRTIFMADKEKKMVSVMRIDTKDDTTSSSPTSQNKSKSKTSPVKSLALHDVPHTGFDINKDDELHPLNKLPVSDDPNDPDYLQFNANPDTVDPDAPVTSQVDQWKSTAKTKGVCFNCWSAGKGKRCLMHKEQLENNSANKSKESALMCKNWDLGVLRRRYRAEEIQEVFMKSASSLRYDKDRKQFCTVVEQKHPIYRLTSHRLARYNFTSRRKHHVTAWLHSFIELLRTGRVPGEQVNKSAAMLRLRNSLMNLRVVRKFSNGHYERHPKAPITGTTLAERRGQLKLIVEKKKIFERPENKKEEKIFRYIVVDGVPVPVSLYLPRVYELFAPKSIPMPEPSYKAEPEVATPNIYISEEDPTAWIERMVSRISRDVTQQAKLMVQTMSPIPGIDKLKRTKYPPPLTIKFATFARKPRKNNMAIGGLSAELTVYELVTTYVPPQYGHFTVMDRASIAPDISAEITAAFRTAAVSPISQIYVDRMLQHPLNSRRPPTITLSTAMDPTNKWYFGFNRPNQTGEEEPHGFRTAVFCMAPIFDSTTNPDTFLPSHDVATLNLPSANRTVTTHADRNYPFCEPTNRDNTTLDFYHLLLLGVCSPSKEQVFTNLGVQEPGDFMRGCDSSRPLGHCVAVIYRSWAFLQKAPIEEFLTDDGVPYWYDRRTGETFWERPLHKEEKVPVKEGGSVLGGGGEMPSIGQGASEGYKPRYDQRDMRKAMTRKHETEEMTIERRKAAAQSAKWANEKGILPELPKIDIPENSVEVLDSDRSDFNPGMLGAAQKPASGAGDKLSSMDGGRPASVQQPGRGAAGSPTSQQGPTSPQRLGSPSRGSKRNSSIGSASDAGFQQQQQGKSPLMAGVGALNPETANIVNNLTQTLAGALAGGVTNPEDILKLGMGLGMSLQAQGVVGVAPPAEQAGGGSKSPSRGILQTPGSPDDDARAMTANSGWDVKLREPMGPGGHPIGMASPTKHVGSQENLDHASEKDQVNTLLKDTSEIKTSDSFKGLVVVEPTPAPDEITGADRNILMDSEEMMKLTVPVVAYPERVGPLEVEYETHPAAGYGTSFVKEGEGESQKVMNGSNGVVVRKSADAIPEGFLNAIGATHVGQQNVDYLPNVPNLPQCKPVGRVKPRSAAEDWLAIGFDPWSAGKEPLSTEFITSLTTAAATVKDESILDNKEAEGAFINLMDKKGVEAMQEIAAQENKMAQDFAELCSYVRHGKYREVEEKMNEPDWTLPIDYPDAVGNTLLMVACQNGNKRIAKLCLRRGAELNKQNINGQSCLHYAFGYGFEDLGEYLIEKGADDSLKNADNLTCYEGLNMTDVSGI
ncbi:hypothetical protein TrVE_jg11590 [Triparma verrucosa]|uniref:WW domain-containing protein n=1 Tax=Triparma verrucosa TaxID=1606542 RepID=A0A9W7BBP4_9STRA|nr:hypothetical protein TrVE_jg11590 [Triparma verrucosa]